LTSVIDSKHTIAGGIAADLRGVFDYSAYTPDPDPHHQKGLDAARESFRQQLYVNLLKAYDTSVIAQYDIESSTPWTGKEVIAGHQPRHAAGAGSTAHLSHVAGDS
jgi:hypothetical protein